MEIEYLSTIYTSIIIQYSWNGLSFFASNCSYRESHAGNMLTRPMYEWSQNWELAGWMAFWTTYVCRVCWPEVYLIMDILERDGMG